MAERKFKVKVTIEADFEVIVDDSIFNEELAKGVCLALMGKDDDFYNKLSVDLQDDMIGLYERVLDEDELKKQLCEMLEIKTIAKYDNIESKTPVKEYKVNENDHSLLGRLRKFQKELNEENK